VLLEAFGVDEDRHAGVTAETIASLEDPRFTHYLVADGDRPLAVARRASFDGMSYLSSIGTTGAGRGRGLGRFVTAAAVVDAFAVGSDWVHLAVFTDNEPAIRLYDGLGFQPAGEPGPDMMLIG
jgi:ribosomal protein S18 acetylase RimI-like enzyme